MIFRTATNEQNVNTNSFEGLAQKQVGIFSRALKSASSTRSLASAFLYTITF